MEDNLVGLTKPNILLSYNLVIILIGIYILNLKTYVHRTNHTKMFIETLFLVSKTWKQTRYLPVGKQKDCCTYTELNSIQHKKKNHHVVKTWKPKCLLLRKEGNLKGYILYDSDYMTF